QREYASGILEASGQLLDTIDEVTDLAALGPGARPESDAPPLLAETLELTRSLLQKRAAEAGVSLSAQLPEEELQPACPTEKLRQIIFSMTAGAILRTAVGGSVSLTARLEASGHIAIVATEHGTDDAPRPLIGPAAGNTGEAALALTRRMIESEGGRFAYGPTDAPATQASTASFPATGELREPGSSPGSSPGGITEIARMAIEARPGDAEPLALQPEPDRESRPEPEPGSDPAADDSKEDDPAPTRIGAAGS
ncbi:MAG: hypothetical protein AAF844_06385, partial [Pseudomonadota bacterium]